MCFVLSIPLQLTLARYNLYKSGKVVVKFKQTLVPLRKRNSYRVEVTMEICNDVSTIVDTKDRNAELLFVK